MKSKIFKLIFILSFIPYIYILYLILFGWQIIVNGVALQGIERLKYIVSDLYTMPIIPACLTFQMCYIFRKKTKIMFMCSFIPCLFTLLIGLQCAFFGVSFLSETLYYGFDGFVIGMIRAYVFYVLRFPLLPICLIFQIVYIIIKLKNKKMNLNENSVLKYKHSGE